jgi:hypothetical protein
MEFGVCTCDWSPGSYFLQTGGLHEKDCWFYDDEEEWENEGGHVWGGMNDSS